MVGTRRSSKRIERPVRHGCKPLCPLCIQIGHFTDVRTRDKRLLPRACHDEHTGRIIRFNFAQCMFQLCQGFGVKRIERARAVDVSTAMLPCRSTRIFCFS